jgi:hypothetical protein
MKYTVQLVHQSGHIDTVEQMTYNPYDSLYILPLTVHIANAGGVADTVMLRVLGDFSGIPDADTDVAFDREQMLDNSYPSWGDTTVAIGTGGGIVSPPPDTCFYTVGPYPNPSAISGENVSVLVHYCTAGSIITEQVYDLLGSPVGSAVTITSDGQTWDRIQVAAPSLPGTYYIRVSVGIYNTPLGYTVL